VTAIWGIGERTAQRLGALGITTVADLAGCDHEELAVHFGPRIGPSLRIQGLGGDRSPVRDDPHIAKSRSREETFRRDLVDRAEVEEQVVRLAHEVTASVVAEGRVVTHVAVKLRTATFFTRVRTGKLPAPTTDPHEVARMALVVLDRFEGGRAVRLLGVQVVLAPPVASDRDR
jgi:DNA polymerase-4